MKKSRQFFLGSLIFLAGIAFGEYFFLPGVIFCILALLVLFGGAFVKRFRLYFIFALIFLSAFYFSGTMKSQLVEKRAEILQERTVEFSGIVSEEPQIGIDEQEVVVFSDSLKSKILLKTSLFPEFKYGDALFVKCRTFAPKAGYGEYLFGRKIVLACYDPEISITGVEKGNGILSGILKFKKFLIVRLEKTLGEPEVSLLEGILLGTRSGLSDDLKTAFNNAGVTHIVAISGFNITIIAAVLLNLSKSFYVNRKKAVWLILAFIAVFVVMTGLSASVVRAAIMGSLVLLAGFWGRRNNIRNVLVLSASLMCVFNPRILLNDVGFQLSFLSTVGLIYLSPKLEKYFAKLPEAFSIKENLTGTISAMIMTLPIILLKFGRISLVAPLANILILPAIPLIMLAGFVQLVFASFSTTLGQIIGWFSYILLKYVIEVAKFFG